MKTLYSCKGKHAVAYTYIVSTLLFYDLALTAAPQWHRDGGSCPLGWERESLGSSIRARRTVKAFVYIFDVSEDQGCTSVVRGSNR